jgi:transposase InsO family protein
MEIVGRSMSERLESALREDALKMAIRNRRFTSGLIVHSDRGMRHARNIYSELLILNNITDPMIRNVNYMNNASIKRYFISLKTEMVHRTNFRTRRNARAALCECIEVADEGARALPGALISAAYRPRQRIDDDGGRASRELYARVRERQRIACAV